MRRYLFVSDVIPLALQRGFAVAAVLLSFGLSACGSPPGGALIGTLRLGRPDVLGWSMGGMIAQALAVRHPAQVRRLVLCATYPGTGQATAPSAAARQTGSDFPANQAGAFSAFKAAVAEYPAAPTVSPGTKGIQGLAVSNWWVGEDTAGREDARPRCRMTCRNPQRHACR